MTILHLSSNIKFGGSEQQLIYLVEATDKKGIENYIFCFDTSILLEYKEKIKGEIIAVPKRKAYNPSLLKALKETVIEKNIDIIHIHNGKFVLTYMLADLLYNLPCQCIFSKKDMSTSSSMLSKVKYNYKGIAKVTCVTEAIKERFKDLLYPKNYHKLMVLRDGLNPTELQVNKEVSIYESFNIRKNCIIIGNVANHVNAKDLTTFVNTIDYLVNTLNIQHIHALQIGRFTDFTPKLQQQVKANNLEKVITFTGFIKDGYKYTSQFDVFLMSSQSEGLPLSILESFYYKVPVVSTNVGGIPEAITHNETGLLSETKDFKNLAINIKRLMDDDTLRSKITQKAYDLLLENFTSEVMADKTIKLYKSLNPKNQ
jgi:glycosyltransferase involved in cell wall biosynthesis